MKTQTEYNKIVNFDRDTKEITVLNYTFKYGDGMRGQQVLNLSQ